jgi:prepilin-type processing-associated H-X9-DG protein
VFQGAREMRTLQTKKEVGPPWPSYVPKRRARHDGNGSLRRTALSRRGYSVVDVAVVLALLLVFVLLLIMILPRRRETARLVSCQRNLMQIGVALSLYDQSQGTLPSVPELTGQEAGKGRGPLRALLAELGLADLRPLAADGGRPPRQAQFSDRERRVAGFLCPSDSQAILGTFAAPVSYRACAGDSSDGGDGVFAPGRRLGLGEIEATDGLGYTAGFSERLVGDNRTGHPALFNYAVTSDPISNRGCPPIAPPAWRGGAGASWFGADWQSTLYNHALTPNATPSCIASDSRTALMGASSGHLVGVNVLFCDGSVRTNTPQVDPKIWREWATIPPLRKSPPSQP